MRRRRYHHHCRRCCRVKKANEYKLQRDDCSISTTYDLRLLVWAWAALPLPFSSAARTRPSPESESASFVVAVAFFCFGGGGCGSSAMSTSEPESILGSRFFAVGAVARFFGGGGRSSSRLISSSSSSDPFLAFGLARDAPPEGTTGLLRALAAMAAFFVGIKSSSPSESPPPMRLLGPEPPIDFRVLSVACFRLTFLPLESTTDLSSHSRQAFCRQNQHVFTMSPKQRVKQTNLPFLEEVVEVRVPYLDWSELEKSQ